MDEGHKTALAFLGIFAFLGLAIFFQADISSIVESPSDQASEPQATQNDNNDSETVQASTEYTDTFEGELGSEYVFDIETVNIERQDSRNGRLYYRSQLNFELTEFGEQVSQASNNEEVRNLVQERFTDYPEREGFEEDLTNDVEAVNDNRIEDIPVQALKGSLESVESSENADAEIVVSFEEGESPEIKWGSFSTVWTMSSDFSNAPDCSNYPSNYSGSGTESNPWTVMTVSGLQCMNQTLDGNYTLGQNIDASYTENWNEGRGFNPVGDNYDNPFKGVLEGNGYTVSKLYINRSNEDQVGLFGYSAHSSVKNLVLKDFDIEGRDEVGGISGVVSEYDGTEMKETIIKNVHFSGEVKGNNRVGGVVGQLFGAAARIETSFANSTVEGTGNTGGIAGLATQGGVINKSYSISSIYSEGSEDYGAAGGIVGKIEYEANLKNSYSASSAISGGWAGRAIGAIGLDGEYSNIYYDGSKEVNGTAVHDEEVEPDENYQNLTIMEMQGSNAESNMGALDFQNTWETVKASDEKAEKDGYPILKSLDTENQLEAQNVLESLIGSIVISNSEGVVSTDEFGVVQTR